MNKTVKVITEDLIVRRPTPEEVAMTQSMNRKYYRAPTVKHRYQRLKPKVRTERQHYRYMLNKFHMKRFQIRRLRKEIKEIEKIDKHDNNGRIAEINIKIKKLEKILNSIVVPPFKRLKDVK